ncbi:ABC transporter substrate-binding protein [Anaerotignum lactatifermentans]|uniref:ABC transporter substrate-binding protein n=1 Tax=Anaerotignum lactatifermentans TaxID=160404 RepID=A0ABS2G671_9FIRM|nr:ABC transporter substrate-binding protein [Anaerotignum lactatifermentans]MBM6828172.1 ABC transporter substrate-binding protein [Anaerotignum lactatifermentans]MBM6876665.1 ABC transporter substrate-binding protein [Anaerotignum lactatifermentans]MBM6949755.1 ABC transporter substrate-binding protein [Anaerotignum lactatifermentans]
MKKIMSILLALALSVTALGGCGTQETEAEPATLRVGALKGPTAMGMVKLMEDAEEGQTETNTYEFTLKASPDEITPLLVKGELDIAAVPANLAAVLSQKTDVQVLAINTLGVIYIVENGNTIQSVEDLKGKTIYASGKGATPEYGLNYILEGNGLNPETDVNIQWKSEHAECVAAMAIDPEGIAMLPQPFVTTAQAQNSDIRVALDLTEEWDKLQENSENPSSMITGVVVARTEFVEAHKDAVDLFLEQYGASVEYVNANTADAAQLIEKYDILKAAVAEKALPFCNIVCMTGDEMTDALSGYLNVLYEQNPAAVGGAMPADEFYYHE